ncbi:hypothetical protein [Pseudooctadecabacter jejudonensis]|uniref:Uncharacterized protein n=1 Tax=Pseudooctadecabacter jejudonensis TaxID=1391910 RepID=A0A1Y5TAJ0_9RHOB|nr:hypothetical protein [Pseudooctadecabacter jejudonensis]SLN56015.1 hypothetical protein PSJ8397_02962 [Pseudooctadecabacter jejudonensis]
MISGIAFTFVVLPCLGAVVLAAIVRHWALAAAAMCGGLAFAFLAPSLPGAVGLLGLPFFVGVALGGLAMVLALPRRPDMDLWGRMLTALTVAFAATFLNLLLNANGL